VTDGLRNGGQEPNFSVDAGFLKLPRHLAGARFAVEDSHLDPRAAVVNRQHPFWAAGEDTAAEEGRDQRETGSARD
jgi:hypothetical protein